MRRNKASWILAVAAVALLFSKHGEAQLAKQGTYSGMYGWTLSSTVHQLEEGHVYTQDVYKGTFFNDAGDGFLHESSWVCFGFSDLISGKGDAGGYCLISDKTDNKAFLTWEGKVDPSTGFNGDFHWTGGTGKYTGIKGSNTFSAIVIGSSSEGRGSLEGEWQLP